MAVITKSQIEWNLTYQGEPMISPMFRSFEECQQYIAAAPIEQQADYRIISRVIVTQTGQWSVWEV